jgi:hypothetical protein
LQTKTYHKSELTRVISMTPLGTGTDISGYTITVYVRKPDATVLTKTGTLDDGPTNQVHWTALTTDLSLVGEYLMQAKAVSGGTTVYGPAETFYVEDNLG